MKQLRLIFLAIIFFTVSVLQAWAGQVLPALGGLTGGGTGALDNIYAGGDSPKYAALATGDVCIVYNSTNTEVMFYTFYIAGTSQTESSPNVIKPDWQSAGVAYSGNGAWILRNVGVDRLIGHGTGDSLMDFGNITTWTPTASVNQIGFEGNVFKVNENGTKRTVVKTTDIDTLAELESLMSSINIIASTEIDSLSELNAIVGVTLLSSASSLDDDNVAFDDADGLWTATAVGPALEELNDSINAGVCNGTGAKVHWSQLTGVPNGFADGTDDGSGSVSPGGDGSPGGQIQYEATGAFGAEDAFYYNPSTNTLYVDSIVYSVLITGPATDNPYTYYNETDGTDWWTGVDDAGNSYEFRTNATVGNSVQLELEEDGDLIATGDLTATGADLTLAAAGVRLTGDGDGALVILGLGDGADEDLIINLDDTENTAFISSSTGVTDYAFDGNITGLVKPVILTHASGVHDGSNDQATLTDSGESFTTNSMVGMTIYNITDGSSGLVTANNGTTITATLSGGTGNDWDTNDVWQVGPGPKQSGSCFYISAASTIRHPATAGYVAQYYATAAAAITVDVASASMVITNATASAVDAGDSIDSPATAGSFICLHNASTTLAYSQGKSGTWTDGGAD